MARKKSYFKHFHYSENLETSRLRFSGLNNYVRFYLLLEELYRIHSGVCNIFGDPKEEEDISYFDLNIKFIAAHLSCTKKTLFIFLKKLNDIFGFDIEIHDDLGSIHIPKEKILQYMN